MATADEGAKLRPLAIDDAWIVEPVVHQDDRGSFHEWFRAPDVMASTGASFRTAQANCSVSRRGALRGIHYTNASQGQAKYVTCVRGAILDAVVDLRVGSPTYGMSELIRLDADHRRAVHLKEGLGHAFLALTDDATVVYLCSALYAPDHEGTVHPLDPDLGIPWPLADVGTPILSAKDAAAPTLAQARRSGGLPVYARDAVHARDASEAHAPDGESLRHRVH
ncbi:dTDP-4-dehydrorhamnose 3,5-epimerase family protein [Streptomyces sp. YJ-C3]